MPKPRARAGTAEKLASLGVLAVLAAAALWLCSAQARFNPAVIVAMAHPKGQPPAGAPAAASSSLTAQLLESLSAFSPLSSTESYNAETLSDKIDGKAELYLASGFMEMSCRAYAAGDGGQARVEVFLYAQGTPDDAFSVFSGQRRPGSPSLALTANAYSAGNAVFFAKGSFYAELVADRATPDVLAALESMAGALAAALPAEGGEDQAARTGVTGLFPAEGLQTDSVRLAASDALGMQGLQNVYTADYMVGDTLAGAFLASRASPGEAQAQAQAYQAFLAENGFRKVEAPQGAPPDAAVMAMEGMVQVVMARGSVLAGVHDAQDMATALRLASMLNERLKDAK